MLLSCVHRRIRKTPALLANLPGCWSAPGNVLCLQESLICTCVSAVDALCELGAIDTLLSNFIKPLQGNEIATFDANGKLDRIHCSLNINTETGRLSARRPNLQNQPALEKDRYKVSHPHSPIKHPFVQFLSSTIPSQYVYRNAASRHSEKAQDRQLWKHKSCLGCI